MTEREPVAPPKWQRRVFGVIGGTAASLGVIIPTATIVRQNDEEARAANDVAHTLAQERNTCFIQDARIVQKEVAGRVLDITVSLQGLTDPSSRNKEFDKFGTDVTFEDETGNLVSGLRLFRLASDGSVQQGMFVGHNTKPSDTTDNIEAQEPFLQIDDNVHRYSVQRQNAVTATVKGPLVTDTSYMRSALVNCGTVQYDEQGRVTIIPPQG